LEKHHRLLDDLLDRIEIAVEVGTWGEARRRFGIFRRELDAHIRVEEDLMFPSLDAALRMDRGPTAVMRAEHVEIRRVLEAVDLALAEEQAIDEPVAALEALFGAHNFKEERVLYPAFERVAPPQAYAAVATEVESMLARSGDE
jgi:iron-sulfur cluster repair protein YtfE (RIC family)